MKELNAFSGTCTPASNQTVQVKIESDEVQYELLLSPSNSVAPCDIEIVNELDQTVRGEGGFGSTG